MKEKYPEPTAVLRSIIYTPKQEILTTAISHTYMQSSIQTYIQIYTYVYAYISACTQIYRTIDQGLGLMNYGHMRHIYIQVFRYLSICIYLYICITIYSKRHCRIEIRIKGKYVFDMLFKLFGAHVVCHEVQDQDYHLLLLNNSVIFSKISIQPFTP